MKQLLWWMLIGAGCATNSTAPPNVILISVDTLRADRVTPDLMPSVYAQRQQGTYFSKAYSPANESLLAHVSLFTGKQASEWGELDYDTYRLPAKASTLAATFSKAGYRTYAAVGGGHLSPVFGFENGFDEYRTGGNFAGFAQTVPMAIRALNNAEGPVFLFLHGYDCHTPYIKPGPAGRAMTPEYDGPFLDLAHNPLTYERIHQNVYAPDFEPSQVFTDDGPSFLATDIFSALPEHIASEGSSTVTLAPDDIAFLKGTYDSAVLYADMWLDIFFQELKKQDRWDNTVIAIVSDHGEDLLDHGVFNHRAGLWDSTTHVPMMMWGPGIPASHIDEVISTMDLGATLLGAVGLKETTFPGNDWINDPPSTRPPVVSEGIGLGPVIR